MTVRKAGDKPLESNMQPARGKHFKDAKLTPRKSGEGQARNRRTTNQIRTNE